MPQISRKVQIFRLEHSKKALYRIKAETLSLLGAGSRSLELVVDADQVLAQLLGDGGALLGHHGLLVHADQDGLVGLHDMDPAGIQSVRTIFHLDFKFQPNPYLDPFFPRMTRSVAERNIYLENIS